MHIALRIFLWLIGGLALTAAIAAGALYYLLQTPPPHAVTLGGEAASHTLRVGELDRTYLLYEPATLAASPPLLIAFHGSMGAGADMRLDSGYQFDRLADEHGFLVAYPNGYEGHWNDCRRVADYAARRLNIDDLAFVDALIADLQRDHAVDPARIYAVGISNGAHFVFRLALEHPGAIAAAATFGANLATPANSVCEAHGEPPPIMLINGTADPINPYEGGVVTLFGFGNRGEVLSAPASARYFADQRDAEGPIVAPAAPASPSDATAIERSIWRRDGVDDVVLVTIRGGGHVIPQPVSQARRLLGRTTTAINGPEEVWRFFSTH